MIMARDKCSAEEAFDILTRISQQQNVKVRDLAHLIVDAGKK
jgi:AmiR/NasT family two-component response regulator